MNELDFTLYAVRQTRVNMHRIMNGLSIEQINTIPSGFRNNLVWNYGHVIITQQLLCYSLAGLPTIVDKVLIGRYRKGSSPQQDAPVSESDLNELHHLSEQCLGQFFTDLKEQDFSSYKPYATSFGVTLHTVKEAFTFNMAHESMHLGSMLALRKFV